MFAYEADWLWALGLGDPGIGKVRELINSHIPPGYKLFKILRDFFTSLDWWEFEPRPDYVRSDRTLCLARGDEGYVMYTRPGGSADLPDGLLGEHFSAVWMNTFSAERVPAQGERTSASHFSQVRWVFKSPLKDVPGVLHIRRSAR